MKPTEHYFHTLLFIMLYKVDLCFLSRGVARISQRTGWGAGGGVTILYQSEGAHQIRQGDSRAPQDPAPLAMPLLSPWIEPEFVSIHKKAI